MVTFCGGNTLKSEFATDRQRARFIQAALTGKYVHSAGLLSLLAIKMKTESLLRQPFCLMLMVRFFENISLIL